MKGKIALALAALIGGCGIVGAGAPVAAETLITHRIPAALALEAVGEAVAACAKQGYAETAVLVDADGVRQALLRGDGTGVHSLDSAFSKAYTSATLKANTLVVIEHTKEDPMMVPSIAKLPNMILNGGGVVIKLGDEVIGAIGAAGAPGGELDEACAKAGLDKILSRLNP
ncbi:MAG: heme-binding protein [Dongiales bacterium]